MSIGVCNLWKIKKNYKRALNFHYHIAGSMDVLLFRVILQMSDQLMATLKMTTFNITKRNTDIKSMRLKKKPILNLSLMYIYKIII